MYRAEIGKIMFQCKTGVLPDPLQQHLSVKPSLRL